MHFPRPVVTAYSIPFYRLALNHWMPPRFGRRVLDASVWIMRMPQGTVVEHITLGGRPTERVTVGATERPRAVLYLHGGGYSVGSPRVYRSLAAHLARSAGAVVYNLDYRLAPEHPFPAALDDAVAAFTQLAEHGGFAPGRVAIAGDSAGGGLAVAAARRLTDRGLRPAALGLLSPWTDPSDADHRGKRDPVYSTRWGQRCAVDYLGGAEPKDPGYAPMHGRLDGLPPMLIHCGATELLQPQILRFAELAAAAGTDVELVQHPKLNHSGHQLAGALREASDAVRDVGTFLREHLDLPAGAAAPAVSESSHGAALSVSR